MITLKGKTILVADTNVQDFPSPQRLVKVSKSCVRVARLFGFDPKVAFLSHSTFGKPISKNTKPIDISFPLIEKFDFLPRSTSSDVSAYVSIMEGCSKYCTFCVVPYTRGEEVSRPLDEILFEVSNLADYGVREII